MTECTQSSFGFQAHFSRQVTAQFDGGTISSDAGGLLLRETDRRLKLLPRLAQCFLDGRSPGRTRHTVAEMVSQRVYGLALGYEDLNDHEQLRQDPLLKLLAGKEGLEGPLAGKSTLNRLELSTGAPGSSAVGGDQLVRGCVGDAVEVRVEDLPEHGVLRIRACEQRHRRTQLHRVDAAEDVFGGTRGYVRDDPRALGQPGGEHWVIKVSAGFVEPGDRVPLRHRAEPKPGDLREDEPHPVAQLPARAQFCHRLLIGPVIVLRPHEPLEAVRIIHSRPPLTIRHHRRTTARLRLISAIWSRSKSSRWMNVH